MQTHIVVPLDGSSLAETILPHASALARASSAKVTLLRVIPPVTSLGLMGVELPEHWFDEEMAWSQNYLADVARQFTDEGGYMYRRRFWMETRQPRSSRIHKKSTTLPWWQWQRMV